MKHIAIGPADVGGCAHYRMLVPYQALAAAYPDEYRLTIFGASIDPVLKDADLVVFQRVSSDISIKCMRDLREARPDVKIAVDIDDHLTTSLPVSNPASLIYGTGKPASKILVQAFEMADVVIASTPPLQEAYMRHNPNTVVARNAIADDDFEKYAQPIVSGPRRLGQFRIGYAGTNSHRGDVSITTRALIRFMLTPQYANVRLVFFGEDLRNLFPTMLYSRIEHIGAVDSTAKQRAETHKHTDAVMPYFYERLVNADFDLAIAPIQPHIFNGAKSSIKMLEYGLAGFPILASRYGPYRDYLEESRGWGAETIATALTDDEWLARIKQLYSDPDLRRTLAEHNRRFIVERYLMSQRLPEWKAAVDCALRTEQVA